MDWINAQTFADAIHAAGAPLPNCWGFIDGTLRPCCRPIRNQRILFSGHKRVHGIKFQVPQTIPLTIARKVNVILLSLSHIFCFLENYYASVQLTLSRPRGSPLTSKIVWR